MTRVLVVDDHPVVRAGIVALLGTRPGIEVVAQAGTAAEALSAFGRERPDVVLMDLQLGADDGVTTTRALRSRDPQARVLILTTYDTDADIVNAIEAGAVGYLLKDASPDALGAAVEAAARGETVFAPAVAGRLARRVVAPPDELTEREREVIALLALGPDQPADRQGAVPVGGHREDAPGAHLHQARRRQPDRGRRRRP